MDDAIDGDGGGRDDQQPGEFLEIGDQHDLRVRAGSLDGLADQPFRQAATRTAGSVDCDRFLSLTLKAGSGTRVPLSATQAIVLIFVIRNFIRRYGMVLLQSICLSPAPVPTALPWAMEFGKQLLRRLMRSEACFFVERFSNC